MHYESLVLPLVAAAVTVVAVAVRRRVWPRGSETRVLRGRAAGRAVHDCLQRRPPQPLLLVVDEAAQIRRRPR